MDESKTIKKFNDLPIISLAWDQLFLDPNNPRLHKDELEPTDLNVPDAFERIKQLQDYLQTEMQEFNIDDLTVPMKEKGFIHVGIPMMLVKNISDNKYLVLEGNRRLTAIRYLINKHNGSKPVDQLSDEVINSFSKMKVVDCSQLIESQVEEYLGMIHVGGTKPWDLMPKAKYLFSQFIRALCLENGLPDNPSRYQNKWINKHLQPLLDTKGKKVLSKIAKLNTCSPKEVRRSVAIFRIFIQTNEYLNQIDGEPIKPRSASLIGDTYDKPHLRKYFEVDEKNLTFSEKGLSKWVDMCCITPTHEKPVITASASGESSLRNFNYIVEKDNTENKEYLSKVLEHRMPAGQVEAQLKNYLQKTYLEDTLKLVLDQLNKINLEELSDEWSDETKHQMKKIEEKFKQIKGATTN